MLENKLIDDPEKQKIIKRLKKKNKENDYLSISALILERV